MRKGTSDMTRDMTRGSIPGHLIHFSFPLLLGNLFQLTYNAVDSVIIGQFAGTDALAAVGCANPVINLMILGINGICLGASSLMGTFFGARKFGQLKREAITTILLGLGLSLGIMLRIASRTKYFSWYDGIYFPKPGSRTEKEDETRTILWIKNGSWLLGFYLFVYPGIPDTSSEAVFK